MSENILEVKGLTKDYGDFVLDKLTFTVPKGVIMGLIGENGAGKSTTINCILNEISKTDGNIEIFGKDYLCLIYSVSTICIWFLSLYVLCFICTDIIVFGICFAIKLLVRC